MCCVYFVSVCARGPHKRTRKGQGEHGCHQRVLTHSYLLFLLRLSTSMSGSPDTSLLRSHQLHSDRARSGTTAARPTLIHPAACV